MPRRTSTRSKPTRKAKRADAPSHQPSRGRPREYSQRVPVSCRVSPAIAGKVKRLAAAAGMTLNAFFEGLIRAALND